MSQRRKTRTKYTESATPRPGYRLRHIRLGIATEAARIIEPHGVLTELSVFSPVELRQAPPSPIDAKPQRRASLAEVEALLTPPPISHADPAVHRLVR